MNRRARITFPTLMTSENRGMPRNRWWLALAFVALACLATAMAAWMILPRWRPDWVIAHVRMGDPLVRALVARYGPTHDGLAMHGWRSPPPSSDGAWVYRLPALLRDASPSACATACRLHAEAPSPGHRLVATWILIQLTVERCDDRVVDRLINSIKHDGLIGRTDSLRHLAAWGEPRALPLAIDLLRSPDADLRRTAVTNLGCWGDPYARNPFRGKWLGPWHVTPGRVGTPAAVDPLIVTLGDPDRQVRIAAIYALASIGDTRAAPALWSALGEVIPLNRQLEGTLMMWKDPSLVAAVSALAIADDLLVIAAWGEHQ